MDLARQGSSGSPTRLPSGSINAFANLDNVSIYNSAGYGIEFESGGSISGALNLAGSTQHSGGFVQQRPAQPLAAYSAA